MHGLFLWAVYFMFKGQITIAVVFMVLAVHFKQMALYFALPFAVYALMLIIKESKGTFFKRLMHLVGKIIVLIGVFTLTNLIIFLPFL